MTTPYTHADHSLQKLEHLVKNPQSAAEDVVYALEAATKALATYLENSPTENELISLQARLQILAQQAAEQHGAIASKLKQIVKNSTAHKHYGKKK
jgi:hypothetical protein